MAKAENCFTIGLSLYESLKRNAQSQKPTIRLPSYLIIYNN